MSLQAVAEAARRLDELSCARIVGNAADAVHAAQKAGQPLGTVSPATIVVQLDGSVALRLGPAVPGYAAPEQLRGEPGDRRSDVFALGAVLWEALVRERLFTGADDAASRRAVFATAARPPSELNANIPVELDAICKKALARDPAERYPSAKMMAAEIDAVLGEAGYPESNDQIAAYVSRTRGKTDLLGTIADPPAAGSAARPALATTAFLGSNAVASPAPATAKPLAQTVLGMTAVPIAPAASAVGSGIAQPPVTLAARSAPATLPPPFAAARSAPPAVAEPVLSPALAPSALPAFVPSVAPYRSASGDVLPSFGPPEMPAPAAAAPGHPQPPGIPSIATAETVATPELQGHLAIQPPSPMLIMPPGITVVPSLPPAVLQSADGDFDDDHHVDPSEVVAIRRGDQRAESRGGHRVESRAEPRGDQRTGTSRDVLAGWGWTTGSSAIIDDSDHFEDHARASRKRLVIAIGGALAGVLVIAGIAFAFRSPAAVEPAAAPSATALSATAPSATAAVAPEPAASAAAVATNPAPTPVEPAPPAEPAKVDPPSAEPAKPEPVAVAPPVAPPPPVRPEPAKVAAAAKPVPAKPAPLRAEAKKLEAKKPEPKAVDKTVKRPQVARVATKAQPVDPYGIPNERTRPDPAAAYRTGLQQYAHGDTTGALATFRASLAGNPGFAPTWRGLGLVYEKLGNKGQARVAFRRYLQLAPAASDAEQIRERVGRLGS